MLREKKTKINKPLFIEILKLRGYSIRRFTKEINICTDRTLRRALEHELINTSYLDDIAKELDVDVRYLSGEIYQSKFAYCPKRMDLYLEEIDKYPYSRKKFDELQSEAIQEKIKSILSIFGVQYEQYEQLTFDTQIDLQKELWANIGSTLEKFFSVDTDGKWIGRNIENILSDLDYYADNHYEEMYVNNVIREQYINNPPLGYSVKQIREMTTDEIRGIQNKKREIINGEIKDEFMEKYKGYETI